MKDILIDVTDRIEKYGTHVLQFPFTPCIIVTADPDDTKFVSFTNFDKFKRRLDPSDQTGVLYYVNKIFGNGIFISDGETWEEQRHEAQPLFTKSSLKEMVPIFLQCTETLITIMKDHLESGETIDVQDYFKRLTLDSFGMIGFGVSFNTLKLDDVPFAFHFDDVQMRMVKTFGRPDKWLRKDKQFESGIRYLNNFVYKVIEKRLDANTKDLSKHHDLLSRFIVSQREKNSENLDLVYLRDIVINFAVAGRDTTGTLLTWCIYILVHHEDIQMKLQKEVDTITNHSYEGVQENEYLNCFIRETLRLFPPVPITSRVANEPVLLPSGVHVNKGERVSMFTYGVHRNSKYWDDPETFKPERWLDKKLLKHQFQFMPFYGGPQVCLGKQMAIIQAKIVLTKILQLFAFKKVKDNIKPKRSIVLLADPDMEVEICPRI